MNRIDKDEMFGNLKQFLKSKGVELQDGSYTERIRQGCGLLTESVNLSQKALERAKNAIDKGIDHLRQTIHKQTAPKNRAGGTPPRKPGQSSRKSAAKTQSGKASTTRSTAASGKRPRPKK